MCKYFDNLFSSSNNPSSEDEIAVDDIEAIAAKLNFQKAEKIEDSNLEVPLSPVADLVSPSFENVPFGTEQPAPNQPRNSVLHRRILDRGDRVRYTFRIGRVTGLDAYEGKAFYVFEVLC